MAAEILIVVVLMLLNGVFAGAEIAVLSVRKTRLTELVDEGRGGAKAVQWLKREPERFLATVQVGLTVVGTTAAAFGGESLASDFSAMLARLPVVGPWASRMGLFLVIAGISFLEIVVGELIPKSLALRSAERYALFMGPALRAMASVVKPVVWLLTSTSNVILKLFGDKTSFSEARLSPDEIRELVEEAGRVGAMDPKTTEIASRAIDFRELRASDVMVPRGLIVALDRDASEDELRALLETNAHQRVPVYEGTGENFVGYVTAHDVAMILLRAKDVSLASMIRPIRFVPETARAVDLLRQLQSERAPVSMVVDENGTVVGLVTLEDLLEELVGEILNEHDAVPPSITPEADGSVTVSAHVPIREVNRALQIELPEPDGFTTMAGLCLHIASSIPSPGTKLTLADGSVIEVIETTARRVRTVRVRPPPPTPTEESA
jgi:putative hemolysin